MSPENDLDAIVEKLLEKVPEKDRDLASKWILKKRSEGKTVNSIRTYLNAIATLSKMSPGKAITENDTEDVLNLQVKVREKYRNPVLYCHVLRDFLKKGGREDLGLLVSLNSKKSKKDWQDPKNLLDRSDVSLMLSVTTNTRDKAIIALLWDSGARVHEIASIQLEDLDRQKNVSNGKSSVLYTLWFRKQKVAGEERRIPLYESSSYILRWLRAHPDSKNKDAPLFPSKRPGVLSLTDKAIRSIVTGAGRRAKMGKPTNPHMFRHSRATDLKMRGVSDDAIRAYMGWVRDSDMPMRYISRTEQAQMDEVASKLGYEPLPEPGPVSELESESLLPPRELLPVTTIGEATDTMGRMTEFLKYAGTFESTITRLEETVKELQGKVDTLEGTATE